MDHHKFQNFLQETGHTQKSIDSRIRRLKKVEELFNFNIDSIIYKKDEVIRILRELKLKKIDSKNQNFSNALRTYYTCMTSDSIGKIF